MSILQINYWVLFILALLQFYASSDQQRKTLYFLMCCNLMFFAIFRAADVGADWTSYVYSFERWANTPWGQIFKSSSLFSGVELGYVVLNKLISFISRDPQALVIVLALIVFPVQFIFLYKQSDRPGLSLLVYLSMDGFEFGYTYLRQACALTFILFSYKHIRERNFLKFCFYIFAAFLFHRSALIVLPFYFLYGFKLERKIVYTLFAGSILLYLSGNMLLQLIYFISGRIFVNEFIAGRNRYIFMWISALIIYELLIRRKLRDKEDKFKREEKEDYKFLMMGFLLASTVQSLAMVSDVFVRGTEYYNWAMYILFSKSSEYLLHPRYRAALRFLFIIAMAVVMYMFYSLVLAGDYRLMWSL